MDFEIISEKESSLVGRKEYVLKAMPVGQPTPKRSELMKEVAKAIKAAEELVDIEKVKQNIGQGITVNVSVYRDAGLKKKFQKHRGKKVQQPKKEEKPKKEETKK